MHILIIGAGPTGLTTALSLRHTSHTVTIYEQSTLSHEVGAAINVPPNVARFLTPLFGLDPTACKFVKTPGMYFMSHVTLEQLEGGTFDHGGNEEKYGAPLYYAHREDLHGGLLRLLVEGMGSGKEGLVRLERGRRVVRYVSFIFFLAWWVAVADAWSGA
jgi:salicylate hydroxylase